MTQTANNSDLHTLVKNTSGGTRTFSFLGVHGRELDANETFQHPGDLVAQLAGLRSRRKFNALYTALAAGDLKIVSSPSQYLLDQDNDETRKLELSDNELGFADPSWLAAGSSDFEDGSA